MGADALLAASHKTEAKKPFVKGDFAVLKYSANADSEGLAARVAHHNAGARAFAF